MIWTPDTPGQSILPEPETTYADESPGEGRLIYGGQPNPPEFIAQVDGNVDLRWVAEIRKRTSLPELKFRDVHVWLLQIDSHLHGAMEETWKRTNIVITDPGPSVRQASDLLVEVVGPQYRELPALANILRETAARALLWETPLHRLGMLVEMSRPGLWLPGEARELPNWADPSEWDRRFKGDLRKVREFVGRLNAANWSFCDEARFHEEIGRSLKVGPVLDVAPSLAWALVSLSSACRYFDAGHEKAIAEIQEVRSESLKHVEEHYGIALPPGQGWIDSLSSTTSDHLQAADLAAGFAKTDYQRAGIPGVLARFRAVLYNGKVIR